LVDRLAGSTPPDVFESPARKMARDYEFVGPDELLSGKLPRRALLITFDDGYRSVAEVAMPTLRRLSASTGARGQEHQRPTLLEKKFADLKGSS
jgi:hypothetical protein